MGSTSISTASTTADLPEEPEVTTIEESEVTTIEESEATTESVALTTTIEEPEGTFQVISKTWQTTPDKL